MRATVLVRPKEGILDPEGDAVGASLRKLGFEVERARVGRIVDLDFEPAPDEDARAQLERMCEQLLANPLIESVDVRIEEE